MPGVGRSQAIAASARRFERGARKQWDVKAFEFYEDAAFSRDDADAIETRLLARTYLDVSTWSTCAKRTSYSWARFAEMAPWRPLFATIEMARWP